MTALKVSQNDGSLIAKYKSSMIRLENNFLVAKSLEEFFDAAMLLKVTV